MNIERIIKRAEEFEEAAEVSEVQPSLDPSTVIYTAVFLDEDAKATLISWWEENVGPVLDNVFCHHMTVKYKPSPEELEQTPIGEDVSITVAGYASDDKGQAVAVTSSVQSNNSNPHITVSTAQGIKPFYSNGLLARGVTQVDGPVLSGRIGAFADGRVIFQ